MNALYVDTSAWVKLYVDDAGSDAMASMARAAEVVASSVLVVPELLATLARRRREGLLDGPTHARLREACLRDCASMAQVVLDGDVIERVRRLVEAHPLRSADAIHLASALRLADAGLPVRFVCSDRSLITAARAERLDVVDPSALG